MCSSLFFKFLKHLIEVYLIYNIVLISVIQQSDSVRHIYILILIGWEMVKFHNRSLSSISEEVI